MRIGRFIAIAVVLWALGGCRISRHIVELEPPPQPPLQQLESHLDYGDPDEGKPDYIIR
jgi:hypothetical protein